MRKAASAVLVSALALGTSLSSITPASAYSRGLGSCTVSGQALLTRTTAHITSPCTSVRARLDKYVQNYPTSYYGNWATSSDTGTVNGGTFVGNYVAYDGSSSYIRIG